MKIARRWIGNWKDQSIRAFRRHNVVFSSTSLVVNGGAKVQLGKGTVGVDAADMRNFERESEQYMSGITPRAVQDMYSTVPNHAIPVTKISTIFRIGELLR
jgi:hypothetical protein